MTEPVVEVIDASTVGAHDHPLKEHDHAELRAEVEALRLEWNAAREAQLAADSAAEATVAAETAVEATYDAQADLAALRAEMTEAMQTMQPPPAPVVVEPPAPVEEPTEPEPPVVDHKPTTKKKSGLSWF